MQFISHDDETGIDEVEFSMPLVPFTLRFGDSGIIAKLPSFAKDATVSGISDHLILLHDDFREWVEHEAGSYLASRVRQALLNSWSAFNRNYPMHVVWYMSKTDAALMRLKFG